MKEKATRDEVGLVFKRYLDALDTPDEESFSQLCSRHPELSEDLKAHLDHWRSDSSTEHRLADVLRDLRQTTAPPSQYTQHSPQDVIGDFDLIQRIGAGGMGEVWRAKQRSLSRTVALKLIRTDQLSDSYKARFAREAQAGGRLQHPNIVTTFGYGIDSGIAWIAQEYVEGNTTLRTLLDNAASLTTLPERHYRTAAEVIAQLADALQYAHQAGVVHRDIKPQNILLSHNSTPKLADFGVAKDLTATELSVTGEVVGTWSYMSPEQVSGQSKSIDRRSDIFSLGVVFYELLTLRRPFEGDSAHQLALRILTEDPPIPADLRSKCPPDISVICLKALEKQPRHRYQSAKCLAEDIRRHLSNKPITAKPPSPAARAIKWCKRNPVISSVASVAIVALFTISYFAVANATLAAEKSDLADDNFALAMERSAEAQRAQAESARAEEERKRAENEKAKAVASGLVATERAATLQIAADFQGSMLANLDPSLVGTRLHDQAVQRYAGMLAESALPMDQRDQALRLFSDTLSAINPTDLVIELIDATVLQPAVITINRQLDHSHSLSAMLRESLAEVYLRLGKYDSASTLQAIALNTRRHALGSGHLETLSSALAMAQVLRLQNKHLEAEALYREALEGFTELAGPADVNSIAAAQGLGILLWEMGDPAAAEPYYREVFNMTLESVGPYDEATLTAMSNLGVLLRALSKYDDAEDYTSGALGGKRSVLGNEHPSTLQSIENLAVLLAEVGRLSEAEALFSEALERRRRILGSKHPDTLTSASNLASCLTDQNRLLEAEDLCREALLGRREMLGEGHPATIAALSNLCTILWRQRDFSNAEPLFRERVSRNREAFGNQEVRTMESIAELGMLLWRLGRLNEAREVYEEAADLSRRHLGIAHQLTLTTTRRAAVAHRSTGDFGSAALLFEDLSKGLLERDQTHTRDSLSALNDAGVSLWMLGDLSRAEQITRQTLAARTTLLGKAHVDTIESVSNLGGILHAQGRLPEAEPFLRDAHEYWLAKGDNAGAELATARLNFGILRWAQGDLDQAKSLILQALQYRQEHLGENSPSTLSCMEKLANLLDERGEISDAEELREKIESRRANTTEPLGR